MSVFRVSAIRRVSALRVAAALVVVAATTLVPVPSGAQTSSAPSVPQSVNATAGYLSIDVAWTASADDGGASISSYDVRYKLTSDEANWTTRTHSPSDAADLQLTLSGLTEWESYDVQVAATNSGGTSAWSAVSQATPHRTIDLSQLFSWGFNEGDTWSDGTTLWATRTTSLPGSGGGPRTVLAFSLATGLRDTSKEWNPTSMSYADPICSDEQHFYVVERGTKQVHAYDFATFAHQGVQFTVDPDGNHNNLAVRSLSCSADSGEIAVYVLYDHPSCTGNSRCTRHVSGVRSFDLPDYTPLPARSFDLAGYQSWWTLATALHSDDSTVWFVKARESRTEAYGYNGWRRPSLDTRLSGVIDPESIWSDGTTLWATGYHTLSIRSYRLPQPTDGGPEAWSAAVSSDGTTLSVTFDEALDTTVEPDTARFSVQLDDTDATAPTAVAHTTGDTKSLTLTLSTAAVAGQRVRLSYSDASEGDDTSGIVQDTDGNDLSSFSDAEVTPIPRVGGL